MGYKSRIVVFDFETGGLDPAVNPAVEIALIVVDQITFEEVTRYETVIKPYQITEGVEPEYHPKAMEIHGISMGEINKVGKPLEQVVDTLIRLFKELKPKGDRGGNLPILCGHNIVFDIAFMRVMFALCGKNLADYVASNNDEIKHWDTQEMAIQVLNTGEQVSYSLSEVCNRIGIGTFAAHRAMPDVMACVELLQYLVTQMRSGGEKKEAVKGSNVTKPKREFKIPAHKFKFEF